MSVVPILIAASLALAASFSAWADFTGKVVGVADGDTITVLRDHEQVKLRLVDIDAPEAGQAFGNRSKRALEALVKGQEVRVVERGQDKYHRTLGRVYRGDLDVNAEQVRQGMAWVFRQYAKDATLDPIEAEAKEQKRGLWRESDPVPPWEWRHNSTLRAPPRPFPKPISPSPSRCAAPAPDLDRFRRCQTDDCTTPFS